MKSWEKPVIIPISNYKVNSGQMTYGAERLRTCSGNVVTGVPDIYVVTEDCVSQNPAGSIYCTGINPNTTAFGYPAIIRSTYASDLTINLVCS